MRRPLAGVLGAVVVAGVLALAAAGCGGGKAANGPGASAKKGAAGAPADTGAAVLGASDVARVTRADLAEGVPVSGSLRPAVDVRITSPVAEVLESVLVREGQAVRKGEVLARFRAASLRPAAVSGDAARAIARADYERTQNLFREGAVAKRDVESAESTLRAAEATAAMANKRLADATVRAPVAGVIAVRSVQGGDRVAEGDPLFELVNTSELEFDASVPSDAVSRVHPGAAVALGVSGFPTGSIRGHVARVNATTDPATRQVKIYVSVPNPGGRLVGGLFASGYVVLRAASHALAVPAAGVHTDGAGRSWVWVVARGHLARRAVTVGLHDPAQNLVEIVSGLADGETAVVGPTEGLRVGQAVQLAGQEG